MDAPERVYLASRYSRRLELRRRRNDLAARGIGCTSSWLDEGPETENFVENATIRAARDLRDIRDADCLILIGAGGHRGGCHVEVGAALAWRKRVIVVSRQRTNVFQHLPQVEHYRTWPQRRSHRHGGIRMTDTYEVVTDGGTLDERGGSWRDVYPNADEQRYGWASGEITLDTDARPEVRIYVSRHSEPIRNVPGEETTRDRRYWWTWSVNRLDDVPVTLAQGTIKRDEYDQALLHAVRWCRRHGL